MRKELLTRESADLVGLFDCGEEPYAIEVSDWIKGTGGDVWLAIRGGAEVWLYLSESEELIGFGALYPQRIHLEGSDRPLGELLTIAYFGIAKAFRKKPDGPYQNYYSRQILHDLIQQAKKHPSNPNRLALYVNPNNVGAIRLYSDPEFQFVKVGTFDGDDCMVKIF